MLGNMTSSITPTQKQFSFSRAPHNNAIEYSTFDRSHRALGTFDQGYLMPLLVDEVYPGDIFKCNGRHLTRLLTPVHPFMDGITQSVQYFYVPTRLIWNNFKAFMGERRRNDQQSIAEEYQVPMLNSGSTGVSVGSIFDVAGIPPLVPNLEFSALPFRAMNLIYNEWYRDENLADWLQVGGTDQATEFGDSDDISNYSLFKRAKRHDYFSSALPWQQKGEAQSIAIGNTAPVIGNGKSLGLTNGITFGYFSGKDTGNDNFVSGPRTDASATPSNNINFDTNLAVGSYGVTTDPSKSGLIADLTNVTGFTIADLRVAIQLQALKELDARGGTRYKEIIKSHFNVTVSDATLDRPEYLGGYNIPFSVIPVANTTGTASDPQGNLSAFAVTPNNEQFGFSKAFEEHGYVIGFSSTLTTQTYQQGLERFWSRKNKYDFYDPMLANISEQPIKMKEILAQDGTILGQSGEPVNEETFGYQEAWAELRYKPNRTYGYMRSQIPYSLDVWHLAQELEPTIQDGVNLGVPLNQDFIEENAPLDRVIAVKGFTDDQGNVVHPMPQFYGDTWFDLKCTREIPLYSVPSFLLGRL